VARIETLPISLIRMTDDWQHRVDAVWADAAKLTDDELVARIDALAAERDPGDATALAERGGARDSTGREEEAVALYRAAQEGLTNIHKHANAHTALLRLEYLTDAVSLEVRDDGCGIRAEGGGFGLVGMGERVGRLGGSLRVESTAGAGVAVRVELPG